jgi:hypothetical protein
MRLKENKLFVRRNTCINRRIYRDFAFNRSRNASFRDIHTISNIFNKKARAKQTNLSVEHGETPKKYEEELLHYQLKPLILMLRVLGCFPVEISKSG